MSPIKTGWPGLRRPVLSATLSACWLLLQQSLAPAHLLMAALIGVVLPWALAGFLGAATHARIGGAAGRLALTVVWDIIVSNFTVARLVIDVRREPHPAWVCLPLRLTAPTAQALLASIITMTPGTVSAIVDEERALIWVHALDCHDPQALAHDMDQRYQQPLMEIFG
ncbi:Na+/H+ antiporter subunit E [Aquabacterium sp.]|uniref:Na+/H+ antiporter subunit E n=1 Tax=Aquabacterium sp. TaxID=1872578 RepID=UPI002489E110|nr:Na+/H+ antiporter subunit E [Aquabacterium sp.]MDI1260721.1 Na+/H+ antiporter subunit E [Aquabacterium sp.]